MIVKPGIVQKSILYGSRYNSETINQAHRAVYGDSFLLDGFILEELSEKNSLGEVTPGSNLKISLSPGKFCSNGILIDVKESAVFLMNESPRTPKLIVGYTADNKQETPVVLDMISPESVTNNMAVIGHYFPASITLRESNRKTLTDYQYPTYRSASRVRVQDLASMLHVGMQIFSRPAIEFSAHRVGGFYRVQVPNIALSKGNPKLLVFFLGFLLEEETHYVVETPGSLLIKATTSFGTADGSDVTFEGKIANAFVDIIYNDDIIFRERHAFLPPEQGGSSKIKFNPNHAEYIERGEAFPMVFVNSSVQVGGGTLLGPDRYKITPFSIDGNPREAIEINKRPGWETLQNDGWLSDEYDGVPILTITVIGCKALQGSQVHLREAGTGTGYTLPIVYKNQNHADEVQMVETGIPYIANSGQLQVWVNGKICPADHYFANNLASTASTTPKFHTLQEHQFYVNDLSAGAFEVGTVPIVTARFDGTTHTSSQVRSIVSFVFRPNYLLAKSTDVADGSLNFAGLEESINSPGITEALFNIEERRHWDKNVDSDEFWSASLGGPNGNYFVTFESLAGITASKASASYSILSTLTCSLTMFKDVPLGFSRALTGSYFMNYAAGGYFRNNVPPQMSDGTYFTSATSGLYTQNVVGGNENKYYSEKNPVVTYAGLQAFMSNWADSLGFANDPTVAPRVYDFSAGMEYNQDGTIKSGFAGLLANREELGLDKHLNLLQCIENVARNVGATEFTFGYSHGYAFGGCVINLYNGKIGRYEGSIASVTQHPADTEFKSGVYFGSIGFEPPYNVFANSPAVQSIKSDPNQWYYGIITPASSGTAFGKNEVGYRALTINNICAVVVPSSGGATVCKYQFCYLSPGTTRVLNTEDPETLSADLGIKIYCDNGKAQGPNKVYQLAKWFVIGPIDTAATTNLGARFLSGNDNENWYRIDSDTAPID